MLGCVLLCYVVFCCVLLCCVALCCVVLRCAVLRCAVLRCAVLRCAALRCPALCCAVLRVRGCVSTLARSLHQSYFRSPYRSCFKCENTPFHGPFVPPHLDPPGRCLSPALQHEDAQTPPECSDVPNRRAAAVVHLNSEFYSVRSAVALGLHAIISEERREESRHKQDLEMTP